MSNSANQVVASWKFVESQIRRVAFKRKGESLVSYNNLLVQDAMMLLYLCWYDLLSFGGYPIHDLHTRWLNAILDTDFYDLVSCFKSADDLLHNRALADYSDFKRLIKQAYPFAGPLVAPLKGYIDGWYKDNTISSFSQIHCALCFIGRLNLHGLDDLEEEAAMSYLATESRLSSVQSTRAEVDIIANWFPRSDRHVIMEKFSPRHGPGTVAEGFTSLCEKYSNMGTDYLIHYMDNKVGWAETDFPRTRGTLSRVSKVIFVPKSVSKLRTICAEPVTLQWYQQGFRQSIYDYISHHTYLHKRISLEDQSQNRNLALAGSLNGMFSTIDLSEASDSVAWSLVKRWFKYSSLREVLSATRSRRSVLPDGTSLELQKFAPNGSALCFPIECIVFAAICESSIMEFGDPSTRSNYRVYGDDIVIETKYTDILKRRLHANGFIVNSDKSFCTLDYPIFRESCGGEFLGGVDVKPIRLSRNFSGYSITGHNLSSRLESLIDLCNRTYNRLPSVRRFLIMKLNKLPHQYRIKFSDDRNTGLYSESCTNYQLEASRYYHIDYQCDYVKHGRSRIKSRSPLLSDEDIRLFEWLRSNQYRTAFHSEIDTTASIRSPERAVWGRGASAATLVSRPVAD